MNASDSNPSLPLKNSDYLLALLVGVVTFLLFLPFSTIGIDRYHDGFMLKPAFDVFSGKTLFRESFTHYGPLSIFIHAAALKILGASLASLKWDTVFFYALVSAGLYLLWRHFVPRSFSLLGIGMWWVLAPIYYEYGNWGGRFFPWPSVHALAFQTFGVFLFLEGLRQSSRLAFFFSGVLCALGFFCRQNTGFALLLGLTCLFILLKFFKTKASKNKALPLFFYGTFVPFLFFVLFFMSQNSLGDWIAQNFLIFGGWYQSQSNGTSFSLGQVFYQLQHVFLFESDTVKWFFKFLLFFGFLFGGAERLRKPMTRQPMPVLVGVGIFFALIFLSFLSPSFRFQWTTIFSIGFRVFLRPMVAVTFFFLLYGLKKHPTKFSVPLAVLTLFCLSTLAELMPWNHDPHAFWALTPAIGLFLFWVHKLFKKNDVFVFVTLALCFGALGISSGEYAINRLMEDPPRIELQTPRIFRGMKVPPQEAQRWEITQKVVGDYLALAPNAPALVIGEEPVWATLVSNASNAGYYWATSTYFSKTDWEEKAKTFISGNRPIIFHLQDEWPINRERLEKEFHYEKIMEIPDWKTEVWLPRKN